MKEKVLLKKFKKAFSNMYQNSFIEIGVGNQSKQADVELEYNNKHYIKLEAKVFNDTRNNSGHFWIMIGQTLSNRRLQPVNNNNNLPIKYGFLFNEQNIPKIKSFIKKCAYNDLVTYGKDFEVEYVFIYNDITQTFRVDTWINFIK